MIMLSLVDVIKSSSTKMLGVSVEGDKLGYYAELIKLYIPLILIMHSFFY